MRIRTLDVNGFGVFDGKKFVVDAPVVLFYGENEAGKSTLLHFIRNMLFGFPTRAHAEPRYEPIRGGKYGGALQLSFADGQEARLERYEDKGRTVKLIFPDGSVAGEKVLQDRLGGLTRQMYRHLFAFGLTELEQLQTLQTEDAGRYLFSTGFGADTGKLLAAEKKLEQEMDQLFRPRGKTQTIHQLEEQLALTVKELQQSYNKQDEYNAVVEQMTVLEQAIESLEEQVRKQLQRVDQLQSAIQLKSRWQTKKEIAIELNKLPDVADFPIDALVTWEKLAERMEEREQERVAAVRKLELELMKEAALHIDTELLERREPLERLWAGLGVYMENGERLHVLTTELQHAENTLQQQLAQIDPTWTQQHLTQFPLTIAARREVTQFHEKKSECERELIRLHDTLRRLKEREQDERRELDRLRQASDEREQMLVTRLAKYSPLSYTAFQTKAKQYIEGVAMYREARKLLEFDQRQMNEIADTLRLVGQAPAKRSRSSAWMKVVAVLALLGIPGLLWFIDQQPAAWIGFALLFGFNIAWLMRDGFTTGKTSPARRSAAGNIQVQLQQKHDTLQQVIAQRERQVEEAHQQLEQALQAMLHPNSEVAASNVGVDYHGFEEASGLFDRWHFVIEQELDELARIVGQVDELSQQAEHQHGKVESAKDDVQKHDTIMQEAQLTLRNVETSWQQWLAAKEFSSSFAPETVLDMFRALEQAKQWQTEMEQKTLLRDKLEQDVSAFEADSANVIEFANASELSVRLRQQRETAALQAERVLQRQAWEQRVTELRAECSHIADELEELGRQQEDVLQTAQAADEQELRLKQHAYDRREQLQTEAQQLDMVLAAWDVRGTKEELDELLETHGHDQLQYELETARADVESLQQQLTEQKKHYGACSLKKDQLLGGKEHAERLQAYEDERELLQKSAEDWAVRALSSALIQKTKEIVEEERQPRMLQKASAYFSKMTKGSFARIIVPAFEKKLLVVRTSGEQLESSELSRGTAEQLYLAMRFALVDEYARHIRLPLVLDDIFVNFDDHRLRQTLAILQDVSAKNQVFMFTCHRHVRDAVRDILQDRHEIVLQKHDSGTNAT